MALTDGLGSLIGAGRGGELLVRGYCVMRGCHEAPEAIATAVDLEGWLHTGDVGSLDARGLLRIIGRRTDKRHSRAIGTSPMA
jgi:long-subunit acyl-CoA synthetase (AMP-forming)